ncbi:MAG: glucose-6-phosphate isomerase [Candidatus Krumholzibacteria bacterium]|nr:glucose-6-phosphate isomerase [Candidatus Krumholzibacteria bacterium]
MLKLDFSLTHAHVAEHALSAALPCALDELRSVVRREGRGADMLGWLDLPIAPRGEIERIADRAKRIQDENDCLVVVGIGGSYLGARAAIEALPREAPFPVLFAGVNLSPEYHERLFAALEGKRFAVCVISKSGTTLEPAIAFRILRNELLDRFGEKGARARIVAVTDRESGALRRMAAKESYADFAIPAGVGGRFSVLSPVGLFPCAVAGIPVREMLDGAAAALGRFTRDDAANDAVRYAALRHLLPSEGIAIEVLSTFHPELASLCEWWKQLAGESEGKNGRGLFPASTVMSTDLHSLGQYLQEGPRSILETFLSAAEPRADVTIPADADDEDGLNYLAGRRLSAINRTALIGTREAHAAGGIPVLTIETESITPGSAGELFIFFEIAISISARLLGVNPFDQPGVEEYKRRMFKLLGKPGTS